MEQGPVTYEMNGVVIDNVFLYRSQYRENKVGLEILLTFSWRDLLGLKASKTPSLSGTVGSNNAIVCSSPSVLNVNKWVKTLFICVYIWTYILSTFGMCTSVLYS